MKINKNKFLLLVEKETNINKHLIILRPKIKNNDEYNEDIINEFINNHFIFKENGELFYYCYGDSDIKNERINKTIIDTEIKICENVDYYFNSNFVGYIDWDIYNYINKNNKLNNLEEINNLPYIYCYLTGNGENNEDEKNNYCLLNGEMNFYCVGIINTFNNIIEELFIQEGIIISFDIDYDNQESEDGYIECEFGELQLGLSYGKDLIYII